MPRFARLGAKDKEIWMTAAFVKQLPTISDTNFKGWTSSVAVPRGR